MHTYIKIDIVDNFFESEEDISTIDGYQDSVGENWQDYLNGKFVEISEENLAFKEQYPDASIEQIYFLSVPVYGEPIVSERTVEDAKNEMCQKIYDYDISENVNAFYIGENILWLDKSTRAGLKLRFEAETAMGITTTTLWYGTTPYTLPLNIATQILLQIECYASQCYDNTQSHYAALENLSTIEDVDAFDFTAGYPEKLVFTLG